MKSFYRIGVLLAVAALFLAACGDDRVVSEQPAEGGAAAEAETDDTRGADTSSLEDGVYIAGEEFDPEADWRNIVMLEVSDGEITAAEWNAAPKRGGPAKLQHSISGDYGMERVAQWPWHEQAEATAQHLIETQDPYDIELNSDGEADAISGATMTVSYFFELAQEALENGPVGLGPYEDGTYYAEADQPGDDWHDAVHLTVINGYIASVFWAPLPVDGERNKYDYSADGDYGMEAVSDWPWHEHADALARYVVENQTFSEIPRTDEGRPDGITGATIRIGSFVTVGNKALEQADS